MAFADPQSITIGATPHTLARVGFGPNSGSFQTSDGLIRLAVSHQYGRRFRRTLRLDHAKIAPDPLIAAQSVKYSMSTYIVTDTPVTGYTVPEAKAIIDAFTAYLTASTGARVTQLLGGES